MYEEFLISLGFSQIDDSHLYCINLNTKDVRLLCSNQLSVWVEYVSQNKDDSVSVGIGKYEKESLVELLNCLLLAS